jgi:hypothetical protein
LATTSSSPEFTWTSSERANFECSFDGGRFENCGSGGNGEWKEDNVRDGNHVLSVRGRDAVGNLGRTTTHTWIVGKSFNYRYFKQFPFVPTSPHFIQCYHPQLTSINVFIMLHFTKLHFLKQN